jgi:uncharacterized protein (TIGR02001 family)
MVKKHSIIVLLILAGLGTAHAMEVASQEISMDFSIDFMSKYVWRGQTITNGWAMQPGFSATWNGLTAGIWNSTDMCDNGTSGQGGAGNWSFTEFDFYVDYSNTIPGMEDLGYSAGYIFYYFPGKDIAVQNTSEIYGGLSYDTILNPSVTVYYDIAKADGFYVNAGVSHSIDDIKIAEELPVGCDMGLSVGWGDSSYNNWYWNGDATTNKPGNGLNDLVVSVGFPIAFDSWTFTPSFQYVTLLGGSIRELTAGTSNQDNFITGFSLSTSF